MKARAWTKLIPIARAVEARIAPAGSTYSPIGES
jgi:hypothetical protein